MTMNERMARVFVVLLAGFIGTIIMLSWWSLVTAGELRAKSYNAQTAWYEQRIKRGIITSSDGEILARNRPVPHENGESTFERRYPPTGLSGHVVGYSTSGRSRTALERSYNDYLTGSTRELGTVLSRLQGDEVVQGDSLDISIDAESQRIAREQLAGRKGAVVAIEPKTGRVLTLASSPTFNPNLIESRYDEVKDKLGAPLLNRATQALYPPGSTFKVVVAGAALEDGITPTDSFPGGCKVDVDSGPPVSNFGGSCVPGHDLTYALTNSVNITFARLGDSIGQTRLRSQMEAFGFFARPPLDDLPRSERARSGLYEDGGASTLLGADEAVDAARVAIGQERLLVTPLQMALVVAAIANDGMMMHPYLVERARSSAGRVTYRAKVEEEQRSLSREAAADLTEMMTNVVREGTGTAAALSGIDVAGKTGTADTGSGNQVWFIGFAPAQNPTVAIAVTLEGQPAGSAGGTVAAPIARAVMESLLDGSRARARTGG